jgi:hypothetical protein
MPVTFKLKSTARTFMAASALSLLMAGSAFAFDGNAVAERLKEITASYGPLNYQSVETNGTTVVLKNASITKEMKVPTEDGKGVKTEQQTFDFGDITLSDVADAPDGGFDIGKATLPDKTFPVGQTQVSVKGIEMDKLHLTPKGSTDIIADMQYYQQAKIAEIAVSEGGKNIATLQGISSTSSPYKEGSPIDFSGDIDKVSIDLANAKPSELTKALAAMGYSKITGRVVSKGTWSPSTGNMKGSQFDFVMDQGGTLGVTFDIGGYTADFVKEIQEAHAAMAANPDKDGAGLATLGLLQQLTINGASIRFDDASLTGKILDYIAKKQGSDATTLVNQTKAALPILLGAHIKNAAFVTQVSQAVSAYLENPKSLEIRAAPSSPVPVAVLMATGSAQPERLPDVLGVTVTANK